MTIIGIETSTRVCSAALCKDGRVIRQELSRDAGNHAGLLPVYIEQLLAYARTEGLPIDAVALSEGPGSYTGLRIGLSTAKGLCYGLDVPLLCVPTPEVLCHAAIVWGKVPVGALLCPMIDARRMEVYTALYRYTATGLEQVSKIESLIINEQTAGERLTYPEAQLYYFGDGAEKCQALLENENRHYLPDIVPEAQYIMDKSEGRKATGEEGLKANGERLMIKGAEIAYYEPFYLKEFVAAPSHVKGLT